MKKLILVLLILAGSIFQCLAQTAEEWVEKGYTLISQNESEEALRCFKTAIETDSTFAKAYNAVGNYYLQKEDNDSARIWFRKTLQIDSTYYNALLNLGQVYMGEGNFERAKRFNREYIKHKPDSTKGYLNQATVFYFENNMDSLVSYCQKALEVDSTDSHVYYVTALLYYQSGYPQPALQKIEKAFRYDTLSQLYYLRGSIYNHTGFYTDALSDLRTYQSLEPYDASVKLELGKTFMNLGISDSADFYMDEFLDENPDNPEAWLYKGSLYFLKGNYDKVLEIAEMGEKFPEQQANFLYLKAYAYDQGLMNKELALETYREILEIDPYNLDAITDMTKLILLQNTSKDDYYLTEDESLRLEHISSYKTRELDKLITKRKSKYYYKDLLKKYQEDYRSLGLDEYFMLYYGYTTNKNFAPYTAKTLMYEKYNPLFTEENYQEIMHQGLNDLAENYTLFDLYYPLADVFFEFNRYETAHELLFKLNAFMMAIQASGDGEKPGSAFIVISVSDEYYLLREMGLEFRQQALVHEKDHSFDVMTCIAPGGSEVEVYFNIDKAFATLGDGFK